MKAIISARCWPRRLSFLCSSQAWNMSRETNEGVMIYFKIITTNLSTIVHLLVEPIISLAKPKSSMEAYISIKKLPWTATSSKPGISSSLFRLLFSRNILRSNRYWWGTVESHVGNSADHCGGRNTTGKINCTEIRNCISIIDLINGRCVLCWVPYIRWKWFLKQSWASRSDNYLIPINLS